MRFFFFAEQLPVVEAGELLGIGADETEGAAAAPATETVADSVAAGAAALEGAAAEGAGAEGAELLPAAAEPPPPTMAAMGGPGKT